MAGDPIFVATHPRSCSTAFERVFMTRPDDLVCAHEPFGDAFYFGPEHLGERFAQDSSYREQSGFAHTTYKDVLDELLSGDKRVFVKDMAYYLLAPRGQPTMTAPSLVDQASDTDAETNNPTTLPLAVLRRFRFAFLIRDPRRAIPSYYRCTLPPLVAKTHFTEFMPSEAGYAELRQLFDYLCAQGIIGTDDSSTTGSRIAVLDADDLLDRPAEAIRAFCAAVDLDFRPEMLQWDDAASQTRASEAFEKWTGWHTDVLSSTGLRPRTSPQKTPTDEEDDATWREKYGEKGQKIIRSCVDANKADYEYLKQFCLKF